MLTQLLQSTSMDSNSINLGRWIRNLPYSNKLYLPDQSEFVEFEPSQFIFNERRTETPFVTEIYTHTRGGCEVTLKFMRLDQICALYSGNEIEAFMKIKNEFTIGQRLSFQRKQKNNFLKGFYGFCVFYNHLIVFLEPYDSTFIEHRQEFGLFPEKGLWQIIDTSLKTFYECKQNSLACLFLRPDMYFIRESQFKLDVGRKLRDMSSLDATQPKETTQLPEKLVDFVRSKFITAKNYGSMDKDHFKGEILSLGLTILDIIENKRKVKNGEFEEEFKDGEADFPQRLTRIINVNDLSWNETLNKYSDDLKSFMASCLLPFNERPTLYDLMESEIYTRNCLGSKNVKIYDNGTVSLNSDSAHKIFQSIDMDILTFPDLKKSYKFDFENLEEIEQLGATPNTIVKKYLHKPTQKFLAIKSVIIKLEKAKQEKLKNEVLLQKTLLNSNNITALYGASLSPERLFLCMEFLDMSLKEFYQKVHKRFSMFPEHLLGIVSVNILDGLSYLKSKNIMHRDIKPQNILINKEGQVKLCDFGTSRILVESMFSTTAGTILYWPIEVFSQTSTTETKFDIRYDVWAMGITLAEVARGRHPIFDKYEKISLDYDFIKIQQYIINMDVDELISNVMKRYSPVAKDFVQMCLQPTEKRPKLDELKKTLFYSNNVLLKDPNNLKKTFEAIDKE